jgi:hypothetical protein
MVNGVEGRPKNKPPWTCHSDRSVLEYPTTRNRRKRREESFFYSGRMQLDSLTEKGKIPRSEDCTRNDKCVFLVNLSGHLRRCVSRNDRCEVVVDWGRPVREGLRKLSETRFLSKIGYFFLINGGLNGVRGYSSGGDLNGCLSSMNKVKSRSRWLPLRCEDGSIMYVTAILLGCEKRC